MPKNKVKDSSEVEEGLSESATSKSDDFSEAAKVKDQKIWRNPNLDRFHRKYVN